jgi:hypothetical protein
MGWYYRRSKKIGPFRVTVSNSGISTSVGVAGLRFTKSRRGTYFSASPGAGLYYRQRIDKVQANQVFTEAQDRLRTPVQKIASGPVEQMISHESLLQRINGNERRGWWLPFAGGGLLLLGLSMGTGISVFFGITCLAMAFGVRKYLRSLNAVEIEYSLDEHSQRQYSALNDSFALLERCHRVWQVSGFNNTNDWKRNGGASQLLDRSTVQVGRRLARSFRCNCEVFRLSFTSETVYFLPDMILVHQRGKFGSVAYADLDVRSSETRFRETEDVPADSTIVETTWRFVNKHGGADRRFTNNRQIPITLYGELAINSEVGLRFALLTSSPEAAQRMGAALHSLKMYKRNTLG